MEVTKLNPSHRRLAAQILARAFFDYPMVAYYWPDLSRRIRYLEWYWGCAVNYGLRYGEVYATSDLAGISVWLSPDQTHITMWRYITAGYLPLPVVMGFQQFFTNTVKCDNLAQQAHQEIMPGPHWYMWIIAVDPRQQGKGIGTSLMRPGLERADAQHIPCYVETFEKRNIPFYSRRGFALVRTQQVPDSDLCFWCFRREPYANRRQ